MAKKGGATDAGAGIGCLFLVAVVGWLAYGGYTWIDSIGWMSHRENSTITAKENWFVGETKACYSYPLDAEIARTMNKPAGSVVQDIYCDGGPEHRVEVTFWGQTEQPAVVWAAWNCTRQADSFACKQTGAAPAKP